MSACVSAASARPRPDRGAGARRHAERCACPPAPLLTPQFFRFKDHTRLPKHPAVTGKLHQCWACGNDVDAAKAVFNSRVSPRIGFGQGTEKEPEPIKVCLFCSIDCWMGGWPLVRHHYILAGGGSELAPEYENAPPPETTAEPAAAPATDSVAATAPDAAPPSDSAAAAAPEAAPPQE